jgi:hypothetical protein
MYFLGLLSKGGLDFGRRGAVAPLQTQNFERIVLVDGLSVGKITA